MIRVNDAIWDLYDVNRKKTGKILKQGELLPQGAYHLVVGIWVKNSKNEFLVSQRHPSKNFPYSWECTGGSVQSGESEINAAIREVSEELGLELNPQGASIIHQVRRDEMQDFYDAWLFKIDDVPISSLKLQDGEVINVQWVNKETLHKMYIMKELHPKLDYIEKLISISQL